MSVVRLIYCHIHTQIYVVKYTDKHMLLKMCALTIYMDSATLFQPALGIPKHLEVYSVILSYFYTLGNTEFKHMVDRKGYNC